MRHGMGKFGWGVLLLLSGSVSLAWAETKGMAVVRPGKLGCAQVGDCSGGDKFCGKPIYSKSCERDPCCVCRAASIGELFVRIDEALQKIFPCHKFGCCARDCGGKGGCDAKSSCGCETKSTCGCDQKQRGPQLAPDAPAMEGNPFHDDVLSPPPPPVPASDEAASNSPSGRGRRVVRSSDHPTPLRFHPESETPIRGGADARSAAWPRTLVDVLMR